MLGITVVGPGRLGGALAIALSRAGYRIERLVYRSLRTARSLSEKVGSRPELVAIQRVRQISSDIVFITTPDPAITETTRLLAGKVGPGTTVFHTSGALASDILAPFRDTGCAVASFHPLASVSSPDIGVQRLNGAYICIEGDAAAVRRGRTVARNIGGKPFTISPEAKTLYHAAAVCSAGHSVALFDISLSLMISAGVSRSNARRMLQPLMAGAIENLVSQDTAAALTGTFARADAAALSRQIDSLRDAASDTELEVYLALAERSLDLAEKRGADMASISKMRRRISMAKRRRR